MGRVMHPRQILWDRLSFTLLALWLGMSLGFALSSPILFSYLPRATAGALAGRIVERLDLLAWIAFGGGWLLSGLPRWMRHTKDSLPVTSDKLWNFAILTALIFCLGSSFILTPKLDSTMTALTTLPSPTGSYLSELTQTRDQAHRFSVHFFAIRMVLVGALLWGLTRLQKDLASSRDS